jgi:hypothetical protein
MILFLLKLSYTDKFYVFILGMCLVGVFFDVIVCYLSKGIDLYGDNDQTDQTIITPKLNNDSKLNNQEDNSPKQLP